MKSHQKYGFTLVELLVVIAIIGILVSLTLPAVQAAREAARRTSCLNNLVQLSLAMHGYEFANESLPPGVLNDEGPIRQERAGRHLSWTTQLLPYLEEEIVFEHIDQEAGAYADANSEVQALPLAIFQCPSDWVSFISDDGSTARSSYVGCHHSQETPIDSDNNGLLFLNSAIRYRDIRDGSSRTLLISEAQTDPNGFGWLSGTRATLRNTGSINAPGHGLARGAEATGESGVVAETPGVGGLSSAHPGVVVCAFADGSCRVVQEAIDIELLRQLGNRADGELPQPF